MWTLSLMKTSASYERTVLINQLQAHSSDKLDAPIKKDMKVGEIEISLNDCLHFSQSIYTIKDINKKGVRDYLKEFFD